MAKLDIRNEDTLLWALYADVFAFHKAFGTVEQTDDYWAEVVRESGRISQKYRDMTVHCLADQLLSAVIDYLECQTEKV